MPFLVAAIVSMLFQSDPHSGASFADMLRLESDIARAANTVRKHALGHAAKLSPDVIEWTRADYGYTEAS